MTSIKQKYCDCGAQPITEALTCDRCGGELLDTPDAPDDLLQPGRKWDGYTVVERTPLYAILDGPEGDRHRFWPRGSTVGPSPTAPVPGVDGGSDAPTPAGEPPSTESDPPEVPSGVEAATPMEVEPEGPTSEPVAEAAEPPEAAVSAEPTILAQQAPPQDSPPVENAESESEAVPVEPVLAVEDALPGEVPDPADSTGSAPADTDTAEAAGGEQPDVGEHQDAQDVPAEPAEPPPASRVPTLPEHLFIAHTDVTVGGIPGHLEPLVPTRFTGVKTASIRELLSADPTLVSASPERVLNWLVQCAQAMRLAHERGVLVNSFTPDTVFVDVHTDDRPERVAISTALYGGRIGEAPRLPEYAPAGEGPPGPQDDVYQLGALLRTLLTGSLMPAFSVDEEELFRQPMPLVRLLMALTDPEPEDRPRTPEALRAALVAAREAFAAQHRLTVAGVTDIGLMRAHNEDAFAYTQFEEQAGAGSRTTTILVVCDGVGGENAGEEASRVAAREIVRALLEPPGEAGVPQHLEAALMQANRAVLDLGAEHSGAGCTAVAVCIRGNRYWVAHAGDSRAYALVGRELQALTADHSWTAQQVRQGLLTEEEAQRHEQAHVIYRSLGERERLEVEVQPLDPDGWPLRPHTTFLLCSDGVTDVLNDDRLADLLRVERPARELARECVVQANLAGGPDNITALIARWEDPS